MANGIITRKDIIEDQALTIGTDYAKNMQPAIEANKQLVASLKEMAPLINAFRKTDSQQAYAALKQQENIITLQAVNANKLLEASELSLEKIKQAKLKTDQAALNVQAKIESAKKRNTQLTVEERVQNEVNNRLLKQEARERLGLVGTYEKLNRSRLEAQKRLADLLSAEVKNNAEIKVAQREYQMLDVRVKAVDEATKNYSKNIGNYRSAFEGLNGTMKSLIATFGLVTGIALFGTIVKDIFGTIKDFDRQLIAVGKTTNISGEDLKQFGREVVELGSNLDGISIDGLLRSAEVAGTLGVKGTGDILKFSTAIEKLKLTSDIISDEQVQNFAKFIEVSSDSFENADRLASVITELGNNMATTEAQVLSNATEIQKGVAVYETSAQGVLGLGAATSALGSEAESSRSAIQSTFKVINDATVKGANLEKVLKLTGLTQKELSDQFNNDATGVFQKFVKGLSNAKDEGENLSVVLEDLGITEKRAFTVVGSLAANYSVLENAMNLANVEYVNNIALNKEVEAASQSIASIIGDIKDEFEAYVLATNDANNGTEIITKTLKFFRDNLKDIIEGFLKYGSVIVTFLAIQKLLNFLSLTYNAIKVAGVAAQISFTTATGLGTAAMKAQALVAQEATLAQEGLNVAVKATPWGIILAALAAVVVAYVVFNDELSKNEKLLIRINNQTKELQETEANYSKEGDASRDRRFKSIEEEIKLRRAKGEDSKKLDQEEIARKKEVVQADIDQYGALKKQEIERTRTQIEQSEIRIAQLTKEGSILEKSGYRVSKQGRTSDEINTLVDSEKEKLKVSKNALFQNSKITIEEQKRLNELLGDLDKDKAVKEAAFQQEENKKAIAARQKRLKEAFDAEKKAQEDLFKLQKQRLERQIQVSDELSKDEAENDDIRIAAALNSQQKQIELAELVKQNALDADRFVLEKDKLSANEKTRIKEEASYKIVDIEKKTADEIDKINQFDLKSYEDNLKEGVAKIEIAMNSELAAENKRFAALGDLELLSQNQREKAIEEHERNIFEIKKEFALATANLQANNLQAELDAFKLQNDGSKESAAIILDIENRLSQARLRITELGNDKFKEGEENKTKSAKEQAIEILEISQDLTSALSDLANAFTDGKIQNIEIEIDKNNEYYERQIELAGNDERQKSLLENERAKKEKELQKEKRKEQQKQAIFNKAATAVEVAIQTSLAVISALAQVPKFDFGISASAIAGIYAGIGAIQLAAVLAAPIPKYKMGRKGGPAEVAEVGDGGVAEVVSRPDGSGAKMTPNKPTLTFLQKDDVVHKSVADYNEYMRRSVMKGFYKEKELASTYHLIASNNGVDNTDILREIKEAIKKQKMNVQVTNKIDFGYENYRNSNINWRA